MVRKRSIAKLIVDHFADERRIIVSNWRIEIAYYNLAVEHDFMPPDSSRLAKLIRTLLSKDQIRPVEGVATVYEISVPFASLLPSPAEGILQEANPLGVFGFQSALVYHGLTDELSSDMYFYLAGKKAARIPHGTKPDDWSDFPFPGSRRPGKIKDRNVIYANTKPEWNFGVTIGYVEGIPIFITDLEKTIVDSFRSPEKCGGISSVVEAWIRAADLMDLDLLVGYVEKIGQALLKQRVGYVFEALGKKHNAFDAWSKNSVRGSSAKLIAAEEFVSRYSDRWNLSLNLPESMISRLNNEGASNS